MAYWIIGETEWSQEKFRNMFEISMYVTLSLIVATPLLYVIESKLKKNNV